MATGLSGRRPKATFNQLLRVEDGITTELSTVLDGSGVETPLKLSSTSVALHNLVFTTTGAAANKILSISSDGTSMVWVNQQSGSGGGGDLPPDAIYYSYNQDGVVEVMTEHFGSDVRTTTYVYDANGKVEQITIEYLGSTRIENYTYLNGKVISMIATNQ